MLHQVPRAQTWFLKPREWFYEVALTIVHAILQKRNGLTDPLEYSVL